MKSFSFFALSVAILMVTKSVAVSAEFYDEKIENPDGSITFSKPVFDSSKDLRISYSSSKNGVCKWLGYDKSVDATYDGLWIHEPKGANLDQNGNLTSIRDSRHFIDAIICKNINSRSKASSQYHSIKELADHKTVMIEGPQFNYRGTETPIASLSNETGVCKLFGFKRAIQSESTHHFWVTDPLPIINENGALERLDHNDSSTSAGTEPIDYFTEIACSK